MDIAISVLLILVGLLIIGYWILYIFGLYLPQNVRLRESGGYIVFHIIAEIITALLCVTAGVWLVLNLRGGNLVALLGVGMLLYTSINGLAWKEVKTRPIVSLLFIPPTIIAIFIAAYLLLF